MAAKLECPCEYDETKFCNPMDCPIQVKPIDCTVYISDDSELHAKLTDKEIEELR